MPKVSSKKQRMANLSKLAAKAKETASLSIATVSPQPIPEEMEVDQVVEISQPMQNTVELAWNSEAQASTQRYSHSGAHSDRHVRLIAQRSREIAKGNAKIDSFFAPVNRPVVQPEADIEPATDYKTQVEDALVRLCAFVVPRTNVQSEQHKLGISQMAKYDAVYHYFKTMASSGRWRKMKSSMEAASIVYKHKATSYRAKIIREHAAEYLASYAIPLGAQGKHSKRVSVLDDNDIKMKAIKWFRSQPKAKRSIPALVNQLRTVILPKKIEASTLNKKCWLMAVRSGLFLPSL
ncbi:hypothetical protein EDC96DRAFT_496417 [Choanephora cucurbitarum]|nr:hypothetical protein EDC96DRAFT_496396 [Choanephora cucurbitarum]KAI8375748.1 hypothetical protein EDC96DRAFT_496417 [Choanephora cucurbitarum]